MAGNGEARRTIESVALSSVGDPELLAKRTPITRPEREIVNRTTVRPRNPAPGLRL